MTHYEIVKKLIGPIYPQGSAEEDRHRLKNLNNTIELVSALIQDLRETAELHVRHEHSIKLIADEASEYLRNIASALENDSYI